MYSYLYCIIHTGDIGLRGPNGEAGIPGTKGVKGGQGNYILLAFLLLTTCIYRATWHKRREG